MLVVLAGLVLLCLHLVACDQVGANTCANLHFDQVAFVIRNMANAMPLVVSVFVPGLIVPRSDRAERGQREGSAQHRPPLPADDYATSLVP